MAANISSRDQNYVPTKTGSSESNVKTPFTLYANPLTHRLQVEEFSNTLNAQSIAPRDENFIPVMLAVSSIDTITPTTVVSTNAHKLGVEQT